MQLFEAGLAAWRLARMMVYEAGPYDIFARLRETSGIEYDQAGNVFSWPPWNPLHCVLCTSLYTAAIAVLAPRWARRILAVTGMVALIEAAFETPTGNDS